MRTEHPGRPVKQPTDAPPATRTRVGRSRRREDAGRRCRDGARRRERNVQRIPFALRALHQIAAQEIANESAHWDWQMLAGCNLPAAEVASVLGRPHPPAIQYPRGRGEPIEGSCQARASLLFPQSPQRRYIRQKSVHHRRRSKFESSRRNCVPSAVKHVWIETVESGEL